MSARYVLCSVIDEAVVTTPWGGRSDWSKTILISFGHKFLLLVSKVLLGVVSLGLLSLLGLGLQHLLLHCRGLLGGLLLLLHLQQERLLGLDLLFPFLLVLFQLCDVIRIVVPLRLPSLH